MRLFALLSILIIFSYTKADEQEGSQQPSDDDFDWRKMFNLDLESHKGSNTDLHELEGSIVDDDQTEVVLNDPVL